MKFSLIVPVYNVDRYLDECIVSILNQNYDNYEVILIDDGSTDKSGEICDRYAKNNNKVKVFHKKNGGLSDARNFGISHASGDYIAFIDSDDWIGPNSLQEFSNIVSKSKVDVIVTRFIESFVDKEICRDNNLENYAKKGFDKTRAIDWILNKSYNTWPAQKLICSTGFINRFNLEFLKGKIHEDLDWTSNIIYNAQSYGVCVYPWYYHRMQRDGSITNSINKKNIIDVIDIASLQYKKYTNNPTYVGKQIMDRIMVSVYEKVKQSAVCSFDDRKDIIECINNNKELFSICPGFKYKLFAICVKIFGIKNAIYIISFIK